jgi:sec-independent protein translocase protein TatC
MQKPMRSLGRTLSAPYRYLRERVNHTKDKTQKLISEKPDDTPIPEVIAKVVAHPEALWEHVNDLRKHLFRSVIFLAVTTAISFLFASRLIDYLAAPIGGISHLQAIEVTEPIGVFMKVALLSGFALALPFIAFQMWLFIVPGISHRSAMMGYIAIPAVVIFFLAGMAFAFYVMVPTALPFLLNFMGIPTLPRPASYMSFTVGLMFWVGIAFEFPLIIFVLANVGLVKADMLIKQWRIAIVAIAVIAAAITPTVDPVNMSMVMLPMAVLYFLSIGLAKIAQRRRE